MTILVNVIQPRRVEGARPSQQTVDLVLDTYLELLQDDADQASSHAIPLALRARVHSFAGDVNRAASRSEQAGDQVQ